MPVLFFEVFSAFRILAHIGGPTRFVFNAQAFKDKPHCTVTYRCDLLYQKGCRVKGSHLIVFACKTCCWSVWLSRG
jgi:hypothetical protein